MFHYILKNRSSSYKLYEVQQSAVDSILTTLSRGVNRQLVVMATGMGKTVVFSHLNQYIPNMNGRCTVVLVHRDELVWQAVETIKLANPWAKIGIEKAEFSSENNCDFVIASVQTVGRKTSSRIDKHIKRTGLVITDEAHHCIDGSSYANVLNKFGVGPDHSKWKKENSVVSIGFTATPNRHDGIGLSPFFDEISVNYDIEFGVKNGYLVDVKAYSVSSDINLDGVKFTKKDFNQKQLAEAVNVSSRNNLIVKAYLKHKKDCNASAIIFTVNVAQAHEIAQLLRTNGIRAVAVDGETDRAARSLYVKEYNDGMIDVLCNCGVFTEGFDAKRTGMIVMGRPTKSESLFRQMLGRGLRPFCNIQLPTPEERIKAISDSDKKYLIVIDIEDVLKNNDIISVPSLVGLKRDFDSKGEKLYSVIKKRKNELESDNINVDDAVSLEDMEIKSSEIDIWSVKKIDEDMPKSSIYSWVKSKDGVYHLEIPDMYSGRSVLTLKEDIIGKWSLEIFRPKQKVRKEIIEEKRVTSKQSLSLPDAIKRTEAWVGKNYPHMRKVLGRDQKWRDKKCSHKQAEFISRNFPGITENVAKSLTAGQASDAISHFIYMKNNGLKFKQK